MQETKLIILLKKFEMDDLKSLDKFLKSPYFNTNSTIIKLWNYLKKYAPEFSSNQLNQEKTYKKLFPKEAFNEKKLRQLRSRLLKLVEQFLAIEQFKKEENVVEEKLAQAYYEKELFENSEAIYLKLIEALSVQAPSNNHLIQARMNIHHQLYFSQLPNNRDTYPIHLEQSTLLLDTCYWQQKLFYAIEWFSRNTRYQERMPPEMERLKINILQDNLVIPFENKTIALYILFCKKYLATHQPQTNQFFFTIKQEITDNYPNLSAYDKHWMIKQLVNYAIKQHNANGTTTTINWEKEIFDLYQLGLSDGSILYNGKMTETTFINIVYQACRLQQFDWLQQFLTNATQQLVHNHPANYICLAKSYIAFFQRRFETCLQLTASITLKESNFLEINRRSLQIKAAFECYLTNATYQPSLLSFIHSFNKYLKRNATVSTYKKQVYLNFNLIVKKLVAWLEDAPNPHKLKAIKLQLKSFKFFSKTSKEWLLQHIRNFEAGNTS